MAAKSPVKLFCKNCAKTINRWYAKGPDTWDGETYWDANFCDREACRWEFANKAAEAFPHFSTRAHKERVLKFEAFEIDKWQRNLRNHAVRVAKKALAS